ncbi:MAG: hypothetical protein WDZ51_03035 [Pirellulaceae bacterium]
MSLTVSSAAMVLGCGERLPSGVVPEGRQVEIIRKDLAELGGADAGETATADLAEPTGYVSLRGRFELTGAMPSNPQLNITKDQEFCAPGGDDVFAKEVVVDPDSRGIKYVVLFADGLPDQWIHEDAQGATGEVEFDQKNCLFVSQVTGLQSSQTLRVLNSDPIAHNTKMSPRSNPESNENLPGGGSTTYQPRTEERDPFDVTCSIHPWMKAYVLIRGNAYFAITDEQGNFEIPNLPAGVPLEFRVWQERVGGVESANVNGQDVSWRRGRFTMTLDAEDEAKNVLDVKLDGGMF